MFDSLVNGTIVKYCLNNQKSSNGPDYYLKPKFVKIAPEPFRMVTNLYGTQFVGVGGRNCGQKDHLLYNRIMLTLQNVKHFAWKICINF